jgi:hypothetical protein
MWATLVIKKTAQNSPILVTLVADHRSHEKNVPSARLRLVAEELFSVQPAVPGVPPSPQRRPGHLPRQGRRPPQSDDATTQHNLTCLEQQAVQRLPPLSTTLGPYSENCKTLPNRSDEQLFWITGGFLTDLAVLDK